MSRDFKCRFPSRDADAAILPRPRLESEPCIVAGGATDPIRPFQAHSSSVAEFSIDGRRGDGVHEPVLYRYADPVRGEIRRDVNVVPAVALGFESPLLVIPTGSTANRQRVSSTSPIFDDSR